MADKGKSLKSKVKITFKKYTAGWRGGEEGDPHTRGTTASARRARVEQTSNVDRGQCEEPLLAASSRAYYSASMRESEPPEWSNDDTVASGSRGETDVAPRDVPGDEDANVVDYRQLRRRDGRFAPGRKSVQGDGEEEGGSSSASRQKRPRTSDDWKITGPMPGGPYTVDVIPSYGGHIARRIWEGEERQPEVIDCITRKTALGQLRESLGAMQPAAVEAIGRGPLANLDSLMFPYIDFALIAAFVERWQPDTNTFHLPFGEMTIMIHDVENILGLPVEGTLPQSPDRDMLNTYVTTLFGYGMNEIRARKIYDKGGILDSELRSLCVNPNLPSRTQLQAWYLSLLGNILLADKSWDSVRPHAFGSTLHVNGVAGAVVALAYLYRQLGVASRVGTTKIGG